MIFYNSFLHWISIIESEFDFIWDLHSQIDAYLGKAVLTIHSLTHSPTQSANVQEGRKLNNIS